MPCSQLGVRLDMATVLFLLCDPSSGICLALFLLLNQLITATDLATVEASNFQLDRKTRFIIHGFIDKGEENWLLNMCKVGAPTTLHLATPDGDQHPEAIPTAPVSLKLGKEIGKEPSSFAKTTKESPGSPGIHCQVFPTQQLLTNQLLSRLKGTRVQSESPRQESNLNLHVELCYPIEHSALLGMFYICTVQIRSRGQARTPRVLSGT